MRGRRFVFLIALLVLLTCVLLVGCDGSHKNKENLPLKLWQDYLAEVSSAIDRQYISVSTKRKIAFGIDLQAVERNSGDKYECSLALNINPEERTGQQAAFRITRVRKEERRILLDIFNADEVLYWRLWRDDVEAYDSVVFDHAPLMYTLIKAVGLLDDEIDYTTPGALFEALGGVFFTDGTVVNAERTEFAFDFDLKKGLDSKFARDTFGELPEVLQKLFFSVAKVENYEDMLFETPSLKGKVNIVLKDGLIDGVYCDELNYSDTRNDTRRTLSVSIPAFTVKNGSLDLTEFQPDGSLYVGGRLSDVTSGGKVALENETTGKSQMEYEYEFKAKLDILDLLAANGDLNALEEDNFFHFRLTHKCGAECGAFCADKYDKAKGAVLDVAFSPQDFGSYNIYISVGARAFLGSRAVSEWTGLESILRNQIPEYLLAVISPDTLSRQTYSAVGEDQDTQGNTLIEEILMALIYDGESLSFPIEKLLDIAGLDGKTIKNVMRVFNGDGYSIGTVRLQQTYLSWNVRKYDVKRSAIHLYGYDVAGTKQYTKGLMNKTPALNYDYLGENIVESGGEIKVVGIFNDLYDDGVLFDADTPLCGLETDDIIGSYIKAQAEDIYGENFNCELYIIGHSQIDTQKTGWQEIELYCMPVGRGVENWIWEEIRSQEWGKWLSMTVKTYIRVDELSSVNFIRPEKVRFMQGERLFPSNSIDKIKAELTYKNGEVKRRTVTATNANETLIYDDTGAKYIRSEEDFVMNFYLFGQYCGVKATITPAKEKNLSVRSTELTLELKEEGFSSELEVATMNWLTANNVRSKARLPLDYAKINGYALNEPNELFYINPTLLSETVVFVRAGKYTLSFECDGLYAETILHIIPKTQESIKSEYALIDKTDPTADYFEGYAYNFDAEIVNTYHGEEGRQMQLDAQIRVGYVNSSGTLSYKTVDDPQNYFNVQSATFDGKGVDLPYVVDLPPTLYNNISFRLRVEFLKSGYYELRITLGSSYCVINFRVDSVENVG